MNNLEHDSEWLAALKTLKKTNKRGWLFVFTSVHSEKSCDMLTYGGGQGNQVTSSNLVFVCKDSSHMQKCRGGSFFTWMLIRSPEGDSRLESVNISPEILIILKPLTARLLKRHRVGKEAAWSLWLETTTTLSYVQMPTHSICKKAFPSEVTLYRYIVYHNYIKADRKFHEVDTRCYKRQSQLGRPLWHCAGFVSSSAH